MIESSTRPLYLGSFIYFPLAAQESAKTEKVKEVPWAIGYLGYHTRNIVVNASFVHSKEQEQEQQQQQQQP